MDWFLKRPQWLCSESIELSNNSIYKEKYQFADKTFISTGNILVHKDHTEYYPILIVYPEATPYVPPTVYILKNSIDEEAARKYSLLSPEKIEKEIRQNVRFFNRRHQNEDGSICFVETGDLHSESAEIYPIESIIKRLRAWLSGKIPKDSREVELFAHFRDKCKDFQYLLPDLFFDIEVVKGVFYAGLPSIIVANLFMSDFWKRIYLGEIIFGENKAGVSLPPKIYKKEVGTFFADLSDDPLEFIKWMEKDEVQENIDKGKIIKGYWWDISKEPEPFTKIAELAQYIGGGNKIEGFEELIDSLKHPLSNPPKDFIHLGLRFPGRRGGKDWQMFRLERRGERPPIIKVNEQELKERLLDYSVKAVYQEYLTEEYFHMRNKGRAERNILKKSSISIIGCGALGSEISDCLCKAGVGNLTFIDKERFKAHNAVRHSLGINRANFPKVVGLAEYSLLHNPFVNVSLRGINILKSELNKYFPKGSIGVSSIADDNVESYLNEKAVEQNEIVFYCRALRGGKVARVFRVIPTRDACKNCLAIYSKERNPKFVDIPEDESLPVITTECNNPIRPASAADLKIIASLTARIVIDYLQGNGTAKNHWIWSTEPLGKFDIESSKIGGIYAQYIPPHPDCPICQRLERKKVFISKKAYELMEQKCKGLGNVETGGILIGYIAERGSYLILKATGPGPNAEKTQTLFQRDEEFCQKKLENALEQLGSKGLYLGEWHYHPKGSNSPSAVDIKSLTEIAQQENYRVDKPILIILSPSLECAITIHGKNGQCVQLPFKVIEHIEAIK